MQALHGPAQAARDAPVVPGLPLLGSALDANADPCRFFATCHARLGPVFRIRYPGKELLMIAGVEANRLFAQEGGRVFSAPETYARVSRELGTSSYPSALDGSAHRDLRRALAPALSAQALDPFLPAVARRVHDRVADWPQGRAVRASRTVGPLVADLVSITTGGCALPSGLVGDINLYATLMGVIGVGGAFPEPLLYAPPVRRARARFVRFLEGCLADHARIPPGAGREPDFLDAVLALEAQAPADASGARRTALAMIPLKNAGIYLYRLVSFALYEILARPDLLARIRAELQDHAGGPRDVEALRALPTLQGTLLECLRLYPMAVALPRVVAAPFELSGWSFEPGQTVYIAGPATHFLPEVFPEPDRFDPDRYGPTRNEHRRPLVYAPFGLGAHACMARAWSQTLAAATIAALLDAADLSLHPADVPLRLTAFPVPVPEARFRFRLHAPRAPTPSPAAARTPRVAGVIEGLDATQRDRVARDLTPLSLPAGAVVVKQGDPSDRFFLLRSGAVDVSVETEGHPPRQVARLGPGGHFGETGLLQGIARTATVRVTDDGPATFWTLGSEAFQLLAVEADLTQGELVRWMERRAAITALAKALPRLEREDLLALDVHAERVHVSAGATILTQGDPSDRLYVIVRGEVVVSNTPDGGVEVELAVLRAVDVFGEIGVLEGRPRTATVRALTDVSLLALDRHALDDLGPRGATSEADLARLASERLAALAGA